MSTFFIEARYLIAPTNATPTIHFFNELHPKLPYITQPIICPRSSQNVTAPITGPPSTSSRSLPWALSPTQ
jgi:hypothetical protein